MTLKVNYLFRKFHLHKAVIVIGAKATVAPNCPLWSQKHHHLHQQDVRIRFMTWVILAKIRRLIKTPPNPTFYNFLSMFARRWLCRNSQRVTRIFAQENRRKHLLFHVYPNQAQEV